MQRRSCRQWKPAVVMIGANFAFAIVNLLLKRILDQGVDHIVIIAYRQAIGAVFLTPIAFYWEREGRSKLTARVLSYLFFGSLIGITLAQFSLLLGLKYTSSTFSCAFLNMVPVNTFILAALFRLEKVNMRSKAGTAKVLGTVVCIAGAMLLTLYKGMPVANSHAQTSSPLTKKPNMVAPTKKRASWAIGSLLLASASLLISSCAIQSAILSFVINRNTSSWVLKGKLEIITIIYAGMVGSGLCYVGMSSSVEQMGPVFTSAFSPSLQIFVALFEFSILHAPIYLGSVIGSIIVIVGLYIVLWGKSKEAKDPVVKKSPIEGEDEGIQVMPVAISDTKLQILENMKAIK